MFDNGWPDGYDRLILDEVDSTNTHALRIANELGAPTWIMAHSQSAAHGRRGRPWVMAKGNFAATLILRIATSPEQAALRSFVMSLALGDAFAKLTGRPEAFGLKWPNDVLLNGGKVAGILLESSSTRQGDVQLAIGVGVNLVAAPEPDKVETHAVRPVSLAGETGAAVSPEEFLTYLAAAFAEHESTLKTYGFPPIRTAWLDRAARLGERIIARTGTTEYEGTFETIDETGALMLKTTKGQVAVPAAEIYF